LQTAHSYQDIVYASTLRAHLLAEGALAQGLSVTPTMTVRAGADPQVGEWSVGDDARVRITDERFPPGDQQAPGLDRVARIVSAALDTAKDTVALAFGLTLEGA
jgi:hypothetical protein